MITANALEKIRRYNQLGVHYNLVAEKVYEIGEEGLNPFNTEHLSYITAALIVFDMERMMGKGAENKYDVTSGGFASRLLNKLQSIRPYIEPLINSRIVDIDIEATSDVIKESYEILSIGGENSLSESKKEFHVGATKILHFLNPYLFIIIDSNASKAFRDPPYNIPFRNTTQPGYSSDRYIECLSLAQSEILEYGVNEFCALENRTPMMRIFDKLSFVTGSDWLN
jgi:hypothetical protein